MFVVYVILRIIKKFVIRTVCNLVIIIKNSMIVLILYDFGQILTKRKSVTVIAKYKLNPAPFFSLSF